MLAALATAALAWIGPLQQWDAPAECPSTPVASAVIEAGLDQRSELEVEASVRRIDSGLEADVEVRSAQGTSRRTLRSPSCETLLDAVALIARAAQEESASVTDTVVPDVDPEPAASAHAPASLARAVRGDPAPAVVAEPIESPPAPASRRSEVSPYVRADVELGWGRTPPWDRGGAVAVGLSWRRLRAELFGVVLGPGVRVDPTRRDVGVRVASWSAGLRGCAISWASPAEQVAIPLCLGVEAGEMVGRGQGSGLSRASTDRQWFLTPSAGPGVLVRIARYASLSLRVEGFWNAIRPGFGVDGVGEVYRAPYGGVRAGVGVELHFPRRIRPADGMR